MKVPMSFAVPGEGGDIYPFRAGEDLMYSLVSK
jgi:hypothetical protein